MTDRRRGPGGGAVRHLPGRLREADRGWMLAADLGRDLCLSAGSDYVTVDNA
ncbi:hypothetical protein [Streptomyces sp. NPDC058457]|uniref:hypothetical protein n=1 Tax=Streptomyces sp. NPDC058457 TaxID=3346507 RepID=UPI0036552073